MPDSSCDYLLDLNCNHLPQSSTNLDEIYTFIYALVIAQLLRMEKSISIVTEWWKLNLISLLNYGRYNLQNLSAIYEQFKNKPCSSAHYKRSVDALFSSKNHSDRFGIDNSSHEIDKGDSYLKPGNKSIFPHY